MKKLNYTCIALFLLSCVMLYFSYRNLEESHQRVRFGENYASYVYSFLFDLNDLLAGEKVFVIPMGTNGESSMTILDVDDYTVVISKINYSNYMREDSMRVLGRLHDRMFKNLEQHMTLFSIHDEREELRDKVFEILEVYKDGIPEEYYHNIMKLDEK